MKRIGILAGHLTVRAPPPVRPFPAAGDEEDPDDDELAELLAAQALGLDEDEEEEDILGLDEPSEAELLEQLQEPNPHPAVSALRQLWREQEGPFAADELDAAMSHLRARVTDHKSAVKAIERCIAALKDVVAEYPEWAEPLNELATCYLLQANPEQSNRTADQVLELQPAHFDCLARMCLACAIMGDDDRAEEAAGKLEKVCPALARPIRDLVKGLSEAVKKARSGQAGDEPQAIALEIDPETLETLGPILQGMGGFGDAMQGLGGGGDDLGDLGPLFDGDDQEGDLVPGADDDLDDFELEFEGDDDSSGRLADGSEVSLTGLESFPEYNGMVGTIREWDEGRQRYVIELEDGRQIAARPRNVRDAASAVEEAGDRLDELEKELDEMEALDAEEQEQEQEEEDDDEEEELVVEPGVRVELQGLVNAAQHNGKHGVVRSVDEKNGGRFVVELEADGALLSIKPENLIPRARL